MHSLVIFHFEVLPFFQYSFVSRSYSSHIDTEFYFQSFQSLVATCYNMLYVLVLHATFQYICYLGRSKNLHAGVILHQASRCFHSRIFELNRQSRLVHSIQQWRGSIIEGTMSQEPARTSCSIKHSTKNESFPFSIPLKSGSTPKDEDELQRITHHIASNQAADLDHWDRRPFSKSIIRYEMVTYYFCFIFNSASQLSPQKLTEKSESIFIEENQKHANLGGLAHRHRPRSCKGVSNLPNKSPDGYAPDTRHLA